VSKTYNVPYEVTFEKLQIGDLFTTATGKWIVYDKGTTTLLAIKSGESEYHVLPTIFHNYEFTLCC